MDRTGPVRMHNSWILRTNILDRKYHHQLWRSPYRGNIHRSRGCSQEIWFSSTCDTNVIKSMAPVCCTQLKVCSILHWLNSIVFPDDRSLMSFVSIRCWLPWWIEPNTEHTDVACAKFRHGQSGLVLGCILSGYFGSIPIHLLGQLKVIISPGWKGHPINFTIMTGAN
jgi:hypothetical protein